MRSFILLLVLFCFISCGKEKDTLLKSGDGLLDVEEIIFDYIYVLDHGSVTPYYCRSSENDPELCPNWPKELSDFIGLEFKFREISGMHGVYHFYCTTDDLLFHGRNADGVPRWESILDFWLDDGGFGGQRIDISPANTATLLQYTSEDFFTVIGTDGFLKAQFDLVDEESITVYQYLLFFKRKS